MGLLADWVQERKESVKSKVGQQTPSRLKHKEKKSEKKIKQSIQTCYILSSSINNWNSRWRGER